MPAASRQLLVVDMGALKEQLEQHAERVGQKPGPWARRVLADALAVAGASPGDSQPSVPESRREAGTLKKFTGAFTAAGREALKRDAKAAGVSQAEYLERLLLAPPAGAAAMLRPEVLDALTESTRQVLAIGRNLNQIARTLNAYPGQMTRADRTLILRAAEVAEEHVARMYELLGEWRTTRRHRAAQQPRRIPRRRKTQGVTA